MIINEKRFELALLQQRKIYLKGRIDKEQVDKIADMVLLLDNQGVDLEIILYISSKGGNVEAGFDLYDIIRHVKSPVTGIVFKEASSMAILALQACNRRMMMRHAVLGFHDIDVNLGMSYRKFLDEGKKRVEMATKEQEDYNIIIAERSGLGVEKIGIFCETGTIISTWKAQAINLIDGII